MSDKLETARQLLDRIGKTDGDERYRSFRDQLYGLGADIIPVLRENLDHQNYLRRMAAATNLGRLGHEDSVPELVELLDDPQAEVREMALFSLGILGEQSVTEPVLKALHDYDADVRYRALVALGDLNYPHLEDVLIRCMDDESYGVREQALSQLHAVGTPRCLPVVLKALLEREVDMQRSAEELLDRLVPRLTREHYRKLSQQLTPRERRLILNYLESRKLQEVYGKLWKCLQLKNRSKKSKRGLDKYGRLLTSDEERDFLVHAYGRDDLVDTLVDHFTDESTTRSILMVGDAGVGKTAIVHEMVHRFRDDFEDDEWSVLETNTSELISGTRYLGDWETKLKEMTEAILEREKVILYITNPNDLLGAGAHSKSDENFADFFKPYLQRGQIRMIAECTEEDLKNGLTKDPGFLRQFRQVNVPEMDEHQTLEVLQKRLADVDVDDERVVHAEPGCVEQIMDFAESFFTRSHPPGRACDLMDALVDYTRRHEEDADDEFVLSVDNIPPCLSEVTGMSLDLLDDSVPLELEETYDWFTDRLIDQDHAVDAICDRLALVKTGMGDPDKPLGVYFLVGPTGVGKTYFTKLVARRLFGSEDRMVRFDLSEYQGRYAIEKLIGSPHDKDREGLLTEEIRNQPFTVLLLDEFEKADPQIFSLFLQVLDEGRLTDARGRTTDFRQTLIFLTSNLGASNTSIRPLGFGAGQEEMAGHIRNKLDEFFAPEFLNRLDDVLVFNPLSQAAMSRLVDIELERAFERRGFKRRNLQVRVGEEVKAWLAEHGFSERFGARKLKRTIEKTVLTAISRQMLEEPGPHDGKLLTVRMEEGEMVVDIDEHPDPEDAPAPSLPREPRSPSRLESK